MRSWLLAALVAAGAAQAHAEGLPFVLNAGEKVVLGDHDGRFAVDDRQAHAETPEVAPAPKDVKVETVGRVPGAVPKLQPGALVFTFWSDPGNGARLRVANGLGRPVIYSAAVVYADGREEPTTICSIQAGTNGFETWADHLRALRVTGVYDAPKDVLVCGYPERGQLTREAVPQ